MTRITPLCSTTNRRFGSSGGEVTKSGRSKVPIGVSARSAVCCGAVVVGGGGGRRAGLADDERALHAERRVTRDGAAVGDAGSLGEVHQDRLLLARLQESRLRRRPRSRGRSRPCSSTTNRTVPAGTCFRESTNRKSSIVTWIVTGVAASPRPTRASAAAPPSRTRPSVTAASRSDEEANVTGAATLQRGARRNPGGLRLQTQSNVPGRRAVDRHLAGFARQSAVDPDVKVRVFHPDRMDSSQT